ncbi:MAG: UTP--glucose-1-phosphate uridylyltransferase [Planctomycetes bacterium]|nr:UTP--glucose-1-phosphate uridylyltransferase [Planctomycetota bacterium]MCB9917211.1 UTP--glucose-1-phosphate uridylyltransferase [Planctomycetota bacterium]
MTEIERLPDDILATLATYGFDRERFDSLRDRIASGTLSAESNIVDGELVAPESDAWDEQPKKGSDELEEAREAGAKAIAAGHVGALILNGGMATRFGGVVKGIVQALPGKSFLALKVQNVVRESRIHGGRIPVFMMNSFSTDEATRAHFEEHKNLGLPEDDLEFYTQGVSLRLEKDGELFLDDEERPSLYGPGHGDCPIWFRRSGCLERFLDAGGRYLMISNVDNLAARIDPVVLGRHILSKKKLTAEVAPKWPGDKGGSPAWVDGKLWVVEGFRFPEDFNQDSIPVFNTNTFTVNADQLDRHFDLTDCYVSKTVQDREVIQIETLVGELTKFLPTRYLKVKRTGKSSRFFPIKTPADLDDGREDLELICG